MQKAHLFSLPFSSTHASRVFMSSLISSVTQQFGFTLSLIVFTGACLSRISLNNELNAYNLSSASSKTSVIDHGACNISMQNSLAL